MLLVPKIPYLAVGNVEVLVKVGEHVRVRGVPEQHVPEEGSHAVHRGAEHECPPHGSFQLLLARGGQLHQYRMHCKEDTDKSSAGMRNGRSREAG